MLIKANSKTLTRSYNPETGIYSMFYHGTEVLRLDSKTRELRFKHNGWITMNTARAINIALNELCLDKEVLVKFTKSKKTNGIPTIFINGVNFDTQELGVKL